MSSQGTALNAFILTAFLFANSQSAFAHGGADAPPVQTRSAVVAGSEVLVQATQIGRSTFPPGDTKTGGIGQAVDGIEGSSHEMLKTHTHAHLSLFYKGQRIAIPPGIGIVEPVIKDNFVGNGKGFYWLHTHDATGILHVESPDNREYTLGNFFDVWGRPLDQKNVAGLKGTVRAFVDGKAYMGNVRDIVLGPHTLITLVVGKPMVKPPVYTFPDGL